MKKMIHQALNQELQQEVMCSVKNEMFSTLTILFRSVMRNTPEAHLEPRRTFTMEIVAKVVNH